MLTESSIETEKSPWKSSHFCILVKTREITTFLNISQFWLIFQKWLSNQDQVCSFASGPGLLILVRECVNIRGYGTVAGMALLEEARWTADSRCDSVWYRLLVTPRRCVPVMVPAGWCMADTVRSLVGTRGMGPGGPVTGPNHGFWEKSKGNWEKSIIPEFSLKWRKSQ